MGEKEDVKPIIGYATGVFDLFHIGHLNIIKNASAMCDRLIVGVSTDELSLQIKGKKPVIQFEERIEIVRSLKYVDIAVPQEEINEIGDWEKYHFHRLFKGDDWRGHQKWIRLEQEFKTKNVEVIYFPYTKKTSSTKLSKVLDTIIAS